MKKLGLLIVSICTILALTVCVDASASDLSFVFDAANAQINISGTLSGEPGELVSVLIDRREEGKGAYSPDNTPDAFFWYQANADGVIDVREKIASSFLGGRYDIIVTGQTDQQKFTFVYVDKEATETLALIDAINLATTSTEVETIVLSDGNAAMLGIDTEDADVTKYLNSAFGDIIALRETLESKKYTIDSFIDNLYKNDRLNLTDKTKEQHKRHVVGAYKEFMEALKEFDKDKFKEFSKYKDKDFDKFDKKCPYYSKNSAIEELISLNGKLVTLIGKYNESKDTFYVCGMLEK